MWIYPNSSPIANATTAETVQKPKETAAKMHFSDEGELRHPTAEHAVKAAQTSPRHAAPVTRKRDTVSIPRYSSLFAMLYALGLSISGVLAAVCSPQETVFLQQYLALTRQPKRCLTTAVCTTSCAGRTAHDAGVSVQSICFGTSVCCGYRVAVRYPYRSDLCAGVCNRWPSGAGVLCHFFGVVLCGNCRLPL